MHTNEFLVTLYNSLRWQSMHFSSYDIHIHNMGHAGDSEKDINNCCCAVSIDLDLNLHIYESLHPRQDYS